MKFSMSFVDISLTTKKCQTHNLLVLFVRLPFKSGIYYGWGRVAIEDEEDNNVYAMVMSIGWNPYYNNTTRSVEVHFIHKFKNNFM
ncbi:unnamed protein product [Pneumocystis jirovecii]|uniref:Riboflavin kinase n=1 Tax=Pneumocystis jirovecii TaxID=42068 RepID=L0P899_PNEJI|nr:unnamed protein product [Pneumocystis jirovecii]